MLNRKKFLSCLMTAVLVITLFAACSGGTNSDSNAKKPAETTESSASTDTPASADEEDASEENVNEDGTVNNPELVEIDENKLVFWSLFSGGDGEFMDQIISEYNATNPSKQVQSVMLVWADYYTKLGTAVAAGKGPDIGVSHASKLPELVEQGIVIPFDTYAESSGTNWGDFTAGMNSSVTFDDEHYAMPLDTHAEIMFINKDILEKAGVALDANGKLPISSDADFKAVLDTLLANLGEDEIAISFPQAGDDPYRVWWATYFQMGGPQIINEDATAVTLDKDIAVKAAEYVKSLYDNSYIPPSISDHQKFFQSGKAALSFGGTWAVGAYEKTENLNFGAQNFPKLFSKDAAWADAHTLIIPTNKKRSEEDTQAAVDFINYCSGAGAVTWSKSGQIPSNSTVLESEAFSVLPYRKDYADAAKTAVLPPQSASFYAMKDAMIKSLDMIWQDQADPVDAIDDMYSQLESNLG